MQIIPSDKQEANNNQTFSRSTRQVQDFFFSLYLFPTLSFSSPLVFLPPFVHRSFRVMTLNCDPSPPPLLPLCSVTKYLLGEGLLLLPKRRKALFIDAWGMSLGVSRPQGVIKVKGLLLLSEWGAVCVCVHLVEGPPTRINQWCSSRHQTTGQACELLFNLLPFPSCFFLCLCCSLPKTSSILSGWLLVLFFVSLREISCVHV